MPSRGSILPRTMPVLCQLLQTMGRSAKNEFLSSSFSVNHRVRPNWTQLDGMLISIMNWLKWLTQHESQEPSPGPGGIALWDTEPRKEKQALGGGGKAVSRRTLSVSEMMPFDSEYAGPRRKSVHRRNCLLGFSHLLLLLVCLKLIIITCGASLLPSGSWLLASVLSWVMYRKTTFSWGGNVVSLSPWVCWAHSYFELEGKIYTWPQPAFTLKLQKI